MTDLRYAFREQLPLPNVARPTATKWMARRVRGENEQYGRWRRVYVDTDGQHYTMASTPRGQREVVPAPNGTV